MAELVRQSVSSTEATGPAPPQVVFELGSLLVKVFRSGSLAPDSDSNLAKRAAGSDLLWVAQLLHVRLNDFCEQGKAVSYPPPKLLDLCLFKLLAPVSLLDKVFHQLVCSYAGRA